MPPASSFILLQYLYGPNSSFILVALLIVGVFLFVCILIAWLWQGAQRNDREGASYYPPSSRESGGLSAGEPKGETESSLPSFPRSAGSTAWKSTDAPSSPVGGTCLVCGATVTEETSATCVHCGAERQRCPICQRYVAGGQDLLVCTHCRAPGHANEMRAWVEQHETFPYCARRINKHELTPLEALPRDRRRKR